MISQGCQQSAADPCVFIWNVNVQLAIVAVHIDDLILLTETEQEIIDLKASLAAARFKMKDMVKLHYCLGVNIKTMDGVLQMSQGQYIKKILNKYKLQDCKPVSTPMDVKLMKDDGYSKPVDPVAYQSMVGSLIYAAIATRPDIAQAVGTLAKLNSSLNEAHLTAVKRVFRFLKEQLNYISSTKQVIKVWKDILMLVGQQIQKIKDLRLATYLYLNKDLQIDCSSPTIIHEDNQGTVAMSKNPVLHKRTKHIDIKFHFVREKIQYKTIELEVLSYT